MKEYAEQRYIAVVSLNLSKYCKLKLKLNADKSKVVSIITLGNLAFIKNRLICGRIPDWATGALLADQCLNVLLQIKDSYKRDTLISQLRTSPWTYAVEPPCTERYARWCERSVTQIIGSLLLD